MSATPRKQKRTFLAVTMITVIAVTTVFIVYAALLASYVGSDVAVSKQGGYIEYSLIPPTWSTNPLDINNGTDWYARLVISGATAQQVSVTWTLHCSNGTKWDRVIYTVDLLGASTIYPNAADPFTGPGYNWGQDTTNLDATRSFHVNATLHTV